MPVRQVTVEYGEDGYPVRVDTIVVSAQHDETVTHCRKRIFTFTFWYYRNAEIKTTNIS